MPASRARSRRPRPAAAPAAALVAALALAVAGCGDEGGEAGGAGAAGGTMTAAACDGRRPPAPEARAYAERPPLTVDRDGSYTATLDTSCGDIVIELDPASAPVAVNSFIFLARQGYYDGVTFHRVAPGFVIQGGDPTGTGSGGPGYTLPDELPEDGYPTGAVAMANRGPDTSGSQFFIVTGDASHLANAYTRFGRVVEGMDVARRIAGLADPAANPGDPAAQRPVRDVFIHSVEIAEGAPAGG